MNSDLARPERPGPPGRRRPRRRPRSRYLLLPLLAVLLLATACLGPGEVDPTGTAPIGSLDAVFADGDGIRIRGWVADPDTAAPIQLSVSSEQRLLKPMADLPRPDVAAVYPGLGPNHGFDFRYPGLAPGPRQICVWAENVGRGAKGRLLGCRTIEVPHVQPAGNLESVTSPWPGVARAEGWVVDPELAGPAEVTLTVDGAFATRARAQIVRADVGAFLRRDPRLGFSIDLPLAPGPHRICATAINAGYGTNVPAGCRDVVVGSPPADRRPDGTITSVVPITGGVRITGTASDPDGPVGSARIVVVGGATVTVPVSGGAFTRDVTGLASGPVRLCVTLVDVAGAPGTTGDRTLPCATAVVGGSVQVGTGGTPSDPVAVGPPPGHPLQGIDRDAGISVRLRDGSLLWLFGDSSQVDVNGDLRYFVNNTAAWAAPGSLTVTRDAVAAGAQPVQFATPTAAFPTCPAAQPRRAMWPLSAVAVPDGPRDRVVVLMGNVCLGSGFLDIVPMGVSVAQWTYDPAAPPNGTPVVGTVVNPRLFEAADPIWGVASFLGADGRVYAYACRGPADGGWPDEYGPCHVARVPGASVADRAAWRFWAGGSTWSADQAAVAAMVLPAGLDGAEVPVSSMSVTHDVDQGIYVMAYSPWPGFTDRLHVRVATDPAGPWTAPVVVLLPGCSDTLNGATFNCYAGTTQPALDQPGLLGLGYYDQLLQVGPTAGSYVTVTVPFNVVVTG